MHVHVLYECHHGIHPRVLKELAAEVATPLQMIFQSSISSGTIPSLGKWQNIQERGQTRSFSYRPVSLTCIVSKILERIIRDNLIDHFRRNHLLSDKQYGFLTGRSTTTLCSEKNTHSHFLSYLHE